MMADLLLILLAFLLGYIIFISSAYFLAKWMLPKIEDEEDFTLSESERQMRRIVKTRQFLAE